MCAFTYHTMNTNITPTTDTTAAEVSSLDVYATYCPEDNKLRLYVGRVPRDEYLALRAEGWKALHKQREAGGGDFVATWTPARRDTALRLCEVILDEDMGPAERAADRAERFAGYLDKRLTEATSHADRFDAGPSAHGFQSEARAERAAARHDRIAGRAVDAWDKAEYWQARTAGVIRNALHKASPSVRMGRIKELELAIARHEKYDRADAWTLHFRNRLAYENAMLEAVGGRAVVVEMVPGGFYDGMRIHRITKSQATGQPVSVMVRGKCRVWSHAVNGYTVVDGLHCINIERDTAGRYQAPTAEDLAQFEAEKKVDAKAKREAKKDAPPEPKLVNPTDEDAERLQAIWNEKKYHYSNEPQKVLRITQAQYSEGLKNQVCKTQDIMGGGRQPGPSHWGSNTPTLAKVRSYRGRVVILTDKPQAAFTPIVWVDPRPAMRAELEQHAEEMEQAERVRWSSDWSAELREILNRAQQAGLYRVSSMTQYGFTDLGRAWLAEVKAKRAAAVTA